MLAHYAPEHEYVVDTKRHGDVDLFHGFSFSLPLSVHLGRVPAVMTVPNLNFLRYPHLYSLSERLIALRLYRRALRQAQRVFTLSTPAREELSERRVSTLRRSRSVSRSRPCAAGTAGSGGIGTHAAQIRSA